MPFLSVIIPIYNVELYLSRCIESVLNQSFKDLEMILVDDGSPDKCPTICDEYAKRDERVKVIHKKNGGLSSARNAGIEIAVGEYLTFLDSDDAWAEDKLKDIIIKLKENPADFLAFSSCGILENWKVYASGDNIFSKN
jgi:glycosyltransferase involved in cell wall biosynthesis